MINEYDGSGNKKVVYGPQTGVDDPWLQVRNGNESFYHGNHLNSVMEMTDASENVVNSYRYKAFGEALSVAQSVNNQYRFTARRWDGVAGLQFNRNRYYQRQYGRWSQWDPIRYQDDRNMYRYVGNNSTVNIDPMGLFAPMECFETMQRGRDAVDECREEQKNSSLCFTRKYDANSVSQALLNCFGEKKRDDWFKNLAKSCGKTLAKAIRRIVKWGL